MAALPGSESDVQAALAAFDTGRKRALNGSSDKLNAVRLTDFSAAASKAAESTVRDDVRFARADRDLQAAREICPRLKFLDDDAAQEFLLLSEEDALGRSNAGHLGRMFEFTQVHFEDQDDVGDDTFAYATRTGTLSRRFATGVSINGFGLLRLSNPLPATFEEGRARWLAALAVEVTYTLRHLTYEACLRESRELAGLDAGALTLAEQAFGVGYNDPRLEREGHTSVLNLVCRLRLTRVIDEAMARFDNGSDPDMRLLDQDVQAMMGIIRDRELPALLEARHKIERKYPENEMMVRYLTILGTTIANVSTVLGMLRSKIPGNCDETRRWWRRLVLLASVNSAHGWKIVCRSQDKEWEYAFNFFAKEILMENKQSQDVYQSFFDCCLDPSSTYKCVASYGVSGTGKLETAKDFFTMYAGYYSVVYRWGGYTPFQTKAECESDYISHLRRLMACASDVKAVVLVDELPAFPAAVTDAFHDSVNVGISSFTSAVSENQEPLLPPESSETALPPMLPPVVTFPPQLYNAEAVRVFFEGGQSLADLHTMEFAVRQPGNGVYATIGPLKPPRDDAWVSGMLTAEGFCLVDEASRLAAAYLASADAEILVSKQGASGKLAETFASGSAEAGVRALQKLVKVAGARLRYLLARRSRQSWQPTLEEERAAIFFAMGTLRLYKPDQGKNLDDGRETDLSLSLAPFDASGKRSLSTKEAAIRSSLRRQVASSLKFLASDIILLLQSQYPELVLGDPYLMEELTVVSENVLGTKSGRCSAIDGLKTSCELLPAIIDAPDDIRDNLLMSPTVVSLLEWRWSVLWPLWFVELSLFTLLLLSYLAWLWQEVRSKLLEDETLYSQLYIPVACTCGLLMPFLLMECLQRLPKAKATMCSNSQFMDQAMLVLVGISLVWGLHAPSAVPEILLVVTTLTLFYKFCKFLRALERFGFLVFMLGRIVSMLLPFLTVMAIVVITFAVCYFVLAVDPKLYDEVAVTEQALVLARQLWSQYRLALLGDFDGDDYFLEGAGWRTLQPLFLFFMATIFVNIVMLNVLIAIVSEGYEEVAGRRSEERRKQLAIICSELEATYLVHWCAEEERLRGRGFLKLNYPKFLLSLVDSGPDRPLDVVID